MKKILSLILLINLSIHIFAQKHVECPYFYDLDTPEFVVDSILLSENETKVFCSYSVKEGHWANIYRGMYIKNNDNGDIFNIIDVEGLPFSPNQRNFTKDETIIITLVFPKISECKSIDIIEHADREAFNIYEIDISSKKHRLSINEHQNLSIKAFSDGVSLYNTGQYEEAIEMFKDCCRHDKYSKYNFIYNKYNKGWIGSSYFKLGQEEKAKEYCTYYKVHPIDRRNTTTSDSLQYIAFMHQTHASFPNTNEKYLDLLLKAYEAQKKEEGANHPLRASILDDIGFEYEKQNSFELALKYYEEAYQMRRNSLEDNHEKVGISYVRMAGCLFEVKQDSLALEYYNKGFEILKENNQYDNFPVAAGLDRIGNFYFKQQIFDKALAYELEAASMFKRLGGNQITYYKAAIAKEYLTIMDCSYFLGNMGDAIKYGNRAVNMRKELFGQEHPLYINSATTLATCYSIAGKFKQAYEIDSLCFASFKHEQFAHGDYYLSNRLYLNLAKKVAIDLSELGRYSEEEELLEKAVNTTENYDSLLHVEFATSLADCYKNQQKYDKAALFYKYCMDYYINLNIQESYQSTLAKYISCYALANKQEELIDFLVNSEIFVDKGFNRNNTNNIIDLYDIIINVLKNNDEIEATKRLYNKKIGLLKNKKTYNLQENIENLDEIAICYYNIGNKKEATTYLKKAISLCDNDSSLVETNAKLCAYIASFYGTEELDSASFYTQKAVDIASNLEGYELWCMDKLHDMCRYCIQNGKYDEGEYYGLKAVDIAMANLNKSKTNHFNELFCTIYSVYLNKNDIQKQYSILKMYFDVPELDIDDYYMFLLNSLAYAYNGLNMVDENIITLEKYIELYQAYKGEKDAMLYKPMIRLAKSLYASGRYAKALSIGSKAMEIINSSANPYSDEYVNSLLDMANYYSAVDNIKKSNELYRKSKQILEETFDLETATGDQCRQLSQIYEHLNDTINAIKYMTLAIDLYDKKKDEFLLRQAKSRLGVMLSYSGKYEEAHKIHSELLEKERIIYTTESEEYAYRLCTIAKNFERSGNYQSAENYFLQALKINDKAFNKSVNLGNYITESLATLYLKNGNYISSYKYLNKCISDSRVQISKDFLNLEKHDKENLWNQSKHIFLKELPNLAVNSQRKEVIEAMYDNTFLFAKGIIFYAESALSYYASIDPEIKILYDEVVKKNLYRDSQLKLSEYNRITEIEQIDKEIRTLHDKIVAICNRKNLTGQFVNVSWKDIKKSLTEEDVVIDFFAIHDSSYATKGELYIACVLKKSYNSPKLITLCYENDLNSCTDDFANLYNIVWQALENEFEDSKNIYFSPWNKLTNIPIEYAVNNEGKILADCFRCYRLSSSRELLVKPTNQQVIKNIVLYGGLKYDATYDIIQSVNESNGYNYSNEETFRGITDSLALRSGFDYLPYSLEEVKGIYDLCKFNNVGNADTRSCKLITGENGTEESFKSLYGKDIDIIHIATHGAYIADEYSSYYGKLFHEDDETKYSQIDNSLSKSFIVMSGGNMLCKGVTIPEGMDDGILSAKEISKLDFHGLDLAVISTCNSGVGDFSSEGTMGIQQGFKKAGAKSILMTVDYIDDKATQLFMVCFYRYLLEGNSKYKSFHKALQYLRNYDNGRYSNPKYWTSFILLDAIE